MGKHTERIFKEEINATEFKDLQSIRLFIFFSRIFFGMLIKEIERTHF